VTARGSKSAPRPIEHPSRQLHAPEPASINPAVHGPSFRFGLERVRAVRKHGEDVAQQELAGALARREDREADYRLALERVGGARAAHREAAARSGSASEMLRHQAWLEHSEQVQAASSEELSREEREVTRRRAVLAEAARERMALDRLEVRRRTEFNRDAARSEGREHDEIALNVFRGNAA
jgi:flagellar export protein FliJ